MGGILFTDAVIAKSSPSLVNISAGACSIIDKNDKYLYDMHSLF